MLESAMSRIICVVLLGFLASGFARNPQKPNTVCSQIKTKVVERLLESVGDKNAPAGQLTLDAGANASKIDPAICPADPAVAARAMQAGFPRNIVQRVQCTGSGGSILCCAGAGTVFVCCTIGSCMSNVPA